MEPRKGTYIFGAMGTRVSYGGGSDKRLPRVNNKHNAGVPPGHAASETLDDSNPCAKLCNLIKAQLCLAFTDVRIYFIGFFFDNLFFVFLFQVYKRFHGDGNVMRLSDVVRSALEEISQDDTSLPTPPIEDNILPQLSINGEGFEVKPAVESEHKFRLGMSAPPDAVFIKTVQKELTLLRNSLPPGIWVKGYEDRMVIIGI